VIGPLADVFGLGGMFWFAAAAALLVTAAMFWRRTTREGPLDKGDFAPQIEASVAGGEIVYGGEDEPREAPIAAVNNPR